MDYTTIADRYLAVFNETDAAHRRELVDALFAPDCRYTDPAVDVSGPAGVDGFLAATQEHYPGVRFTVGGPVDGHHHQARFQWHAAPDGAADPLAIGFDVVVLDDDDRIARVHGFVDQAPPA